MMDATYAHEESDLLVLVRYLQAENSELKHEYTQQVFYIWKLKARMEELERLLVMAEAAAKDLAQSRGLQEREDE